MLRVRNGQCDSAVGGMQPTLEMWIASREGLYLTTFAVTMVAPAMMQFHLHLPRRPTINSRLSGCSLDDLHKSLPTDHHLFPFSFYFAFIPFWFLFLPCIVFRLATFFPPCDSAVAPERERSCFAGVWWGRSGVRWTQLHETTDPQCSRWWV